MQDKGGFKNSDAAGQGRGGLKIRDFGELDL